ncbi:DUF3630 family protein [Colwellia psychrerythraea]|uniref:DUF3630 domain-containing protein n=1 Tax=Colwellia psychrerythraea TaxID=28229 RepID=A0A099KPP2_COLPS|nr:DUF3630 family protein [Colwellia psychrerythraea]KGJ92734.1 Protein of unknown function DUF3630 [Colwellia psychrerythraea]
MNPVTPPQRLESLTYQVDHLNVIFQQHWYQENIETLIDILFSSIMPVTIQEKIIGADRENIRFSWAGHHFVLNFEIYSQSCWIEGQDGQSTELLATLHLAITKK